MLHSITVEDLVKRHILRPGTTLRATPRPARTVAAALGDETIVTEDGLLDWRSWIFADPSSALIGTQEDLTDGWAAWTTPDGRNLYELRQEARQRAPITVEDAMWAMLAEVGVPSRVTRLLADGGISSTADLIAVGPDRLANVAGIGQNVVELIFRALGQEPAEEPGRAAPRSTLRGTSGKKAPRTSAPAKKATAKKAAAKQALAEKATAKKAAAKQAPAEKATAKQAQARKAAAKRTVAKKAPVKRAKR